MHSRRTDALLERYEYPATTDQLIETIGDHRLDLQNGTETIAEVLGRLEGETFESPEEVRLSIYSAVSRKAIGRYGYSDRDPTPLGDPDGPESVSF